MDKPDNHLPVLRDVIDKLGNFQWLSLVDLADSYHQFRLRKEDQPKTAFTIDDQQYMFCVVPFGLKNMSAHLQRIMERLLGDLEVVPFQDDSGVASKTVEEHITVVKEVLKRLTYTAGLRIKLKKCKFFTTEARVLGMIVSHQGIRMDPKKIESIVNWPRSINGKGVMRFMDAANFHREFTQDFARMAAPLDECRNMKTIEWTEACVRAFEDIKEFFQKNLLLHHVNWDKKMYLTPDASFFGIEAWIGQIDDQGDLMPIICASQKLTPTQQRWSVTKRELYGVMWTMKKFRHYLLGRHFVVRVDHKPLVSLLKDKSTLFIDGWIEAIMKYSFSTEYLPGSENTLADALSQCYEGEKLSVNALDIQENEIHQQQMDMQWFAESRGFQLPDETLRAKLIEEQHALGHFGTKLISDKIKEEGHWWPKMKMNINTYVKECQACQRYNVEREGHHPAKSITAEEPWDHIQIDLIGSLQQSENGCVYIFTIVDVCTAYTVIRALKTKDMETIARCLWEVICDYGAPRILQSDNGSEFMNQVVKALTIMYGVEHRLSTAYHPNTNGLVERHNKEVSKALKKFTEGTYAAWNNWLPLIQISLNEAISQRTGSAAFSLMFGRKFNGFRDFTDVKMDPNKDDNVSKVIQKWDQF